MLPSTSNNNNNKNSGAFCNHYIVFVVAEDDKIAVTIQAAIKSHLGLSQGGPSNVRRCCTLLILAHHTASGSSQAEHGSYNLQTPVRTSSHIKCGTISLLPKADPILQAKTHGPGSNHGDCTNPVEVFNFHQQIKAGGFPPLIPSHFLSVAEDCKMNAGPSFPNIAAKGVKPGAKLLPRSPMSSLPSWSETWMKAEDWVPVPKGQEDLQW